MVDASISGSSNSARNEVTGSNVKVRSTTLSNSGYNSSRIGFRGTEDLDGGLAAGFWLEAGINNDDGTGKAAGGGLAFNRRSTVSLSGGFGELRLGRDYTPTCWNDTVFDPFGTNGVGTSLIDTANRFNTVNQFFPTAQIPGGFGGNQTYDRASNSIGYLLPSNLGGFYGQLMYALPENVKYNPQVATPAGTNAGKSGRYIGGRFGYANAGLDVALSYGSSTTTNSFAVNPFFQGSGDKVNRLSLGASYDFGGAKLFGELAQTEAKYSFNGGTPAPVLYGNAKLNGWLVGVTVPVGPGLIRASYSGVQYNYGFSNGPKADQLALGYVYNLSKRTAVYTTVAYVHNKNGAALGAGGANTYATPLTIFTPKSSTGYDFGIRHAF